MSDIADDGLPSGMDMHMLNSHGLTAATSQLSESLHMLPAHPDACQKRHGELMAASDLYVQDSLHFILRTHT